MSTQKSIHQKSIAEEIAEFAIGLSYEDIPEEVIKIAKLQILDALGLGLLSNTTEIGRSVHRAVVGASAELDSGGARTIGFGTRLPTASAALINGILIWSVGFDGTYLPAGIHPCGGPLAAALTVGEERGVDGRALLAAYIAAVEIACRLPGVGGSNFHVRGFHPTALVDTFASAAVASRLRGLDLSATVSSLGLCGSQAAGSMEVMGSWQLWFHVGWAVHAGLMAASVAAQGFTGSPKIFEGPMGFYKSHMGCIPTREELFLHTLGDQYLTAYVTLKPYPSCQVVQSFTDAAFALRDDGIDWREIEHVEYLVSPQVFPLVIDPPGLHEFPLRREDAGISIPYAVAGVMIKGRADFAYYFEDPLDDPDIMSFVKRFDHGTDSDSDFPKHFPGELRVTLRDGRSVVKRVVASKGSPEWPMTPSEVEAKFMSHAERVMSEQRARHLADIVYNLESLDDVAKLLDATKTEEVSR